MNFTLKEKKYALASLLLTFALIVVYQYTQAF
jgi:hypothetical protein